MRSPAVSVVVPTFNGHRYVAECIESALTQSFRDLEVVVSDDGSEDATRAIVEAFSDPRLRLLPAGAAGGAAPNWNRGVRAARGRFVKILCQDDVLHRECIAEQVAKLTADSNAILVAHDRRVIDARGRVLTPRLSLSASELRLDRTRVLDRCISRGTNAIGEPSAVLFRREGWRAAGGFRPVGYVTDLEMWLRLLEMGHAVLLPRSRVDFRVHDTSWSASLLGAQRAATQRLLVTAAAEAGLAPQRWLTVRTQARWLGRSLVFGVSRISDALTRA